MERKVGGENSDRYEIVKLLGQGGCGTVYLAKDKERNDEQVAIKVLVNPLAFGDTTRQRFITETLVQITINHKNIVQAFELINFEDKKQYDAYTMEYVNGENLANYMYRNGALKEEEIDSIMTQLLSALPELHKKNIVHRDLKLENVMLNEQGIVKLNDLGLAKILQDDPKTDPTQLLGTPQYLSPEYIKNQKFDSRMDIYACGVILSELANGKRVLERLEGKAVIEYLTNAKFEIPVIENHPAKKKYQRIVNRAMAENPDKRYQTAEEMREAFFGKELKSEYNFNRTAKKRFPFRYYLYIASLLALVTLAVLLFYFIF